MLKKTSKALFNKFLTPFERFFALEASAGFVLLFFVLLALLLANSSWSDFYDKIVYYPVSVQWGDFSLSYSLQHWVNDGLMVIFFFVVGLEIKRELVVGELSSSKKAALPIIAAIGGMVVPALIYLSFNYHDVLAQRGWGIPMATDIAFALGVLSLVSKRVPLLLKVFLMFLAIVDDLGAVLVIAFFYSNQIAGQYLAFAGLIIFLIYCIGKIGITHPLVYIILGVCLWLSILNSGVHPTIAGVILGFLCPCRTKSNKQEEKTAKMKKLLASLSSYKETKKLIQEARSFHTPTHTLIEVLHPYVAWFIMPAFAFFNAGVSFDPSFSISDFFSHSVSLGIIFGFLIGKPVGILLFSFLAVRLDLATLPSDFKWSQFVGVSFLAGIGFTMALFISHLSFSSQYELAMYSKVSILFASFFAMVIGLCFIWFVKPQTGSHDQ